MADLLDKILPVAVLISLGALLGRFGGLKRDVVDGLKRLIANVSLPVVLFLAFSRVNLGWSLAGLAAAVFAACALSGVFGFVYARFLSLPRPATGFLFQGYEAGMLGYALFVAFFGESRRPDFAAADLGQVLFVFTVLLTQLRSADPDVVSSGGKLAKPDNSRIRKLLIGLRSPALIAIILGLIASSVDKPTIIFPWEEDGILRSSLDLIAGLTMPMVCLVVGFDLKDGIHGASALAAILGRLAVSAGLGAIVAFIVAPSLSYPKTMAPAILTLFLMPPPFVISVYRKHSSDAAYIGSALSLHTVISLVAAALIAFIYGSTAV